MKLQRPTTPSGGAGGGAVGLCGTMRTDTGISPGTSVSFSYESTTPLRPQPTPHGSEGAEGWARLSKEERQRLQHQKHRVVQPAAPFADVAAKQRIVDNYWAALARHTIASQAAEAAAQAASRALAAGGLLLGVAGAGTAVGNGPPHGVNTLSASGLADCRAWWPCTLS